MSSTTKDVNITINNEKEQENFHDNLNETYNEFKKYIIANNVQLQHQAKQDLIKIKQLECDLALKEEEEDKNDNRIRYLKGLLQNLIELKKKQSELGKKYKNLSDYYWNIYKDSKNINYKYLLYSFLFSLIVYLQNLSIYLKLSFNFNILYNSLLFISIIYVINKIGNIYKSSQYLYNESENIVNIKISKIEIQEYIKEIKKLEDSTIALDNWICEI